MEEKRAARSVKTTLVVLGLLLSVVVVIALWRYVLTGSQTDEALPELPSTSQQNDDAGTTEDPSSAAVDQDLDTSISSPPNDETFSSIAIDAIGVTVYYAKGIGPFEYAVSRTSSGTRFVEFTSTALVGTKCTDDAGEFAVIIEGPSDAERQTLQSTTRVGEIEYGLSLTSDTCTSDTLQLEQYQAAFKNGFGSLEAIQ